LRINNRILRNASDPFHLPERQFIKLFRLNRDTARHLCDLIAPHIPHDRVTAIPAVLKILITLFFYGHGSYQKCVGSGYLFGMSQPSVSRAIKCVTGLMNVNLLNIWVIYPTTVENKQTAKNQFYERYHFQGTIGCIDCTHIAIVAPPATDMNNPGLVYINRKSYHSINVQIICSAYLKIIAINAQHPGSVHDAAIWQTSLIHQHMRQKYDEGKFDMKYVVIRDLNRNRTGAHDLRFEPSRFSLCLCNIQSDVLIIIF
jgi:DDE superfamily endonuclease